MNYAPNSILSDESVTLEDLSNTVSLMGDTRRKFLNKIFDMRRAAAVASVILQPVFLHVTGFFGHKISTFQNRVIEEYYCVYITRHLYR